ncbi:M23 family metallopeptidase [Nocardia brasiliensis]|nr:M23 family metallopeptidase [Nocardia brasiliensis]
MSGYGPRGFEQRGIPKLHHPDDFQQGFSNSLRRDEPWMAHEDRRPAADRRPTTEDRWSLDRERPSDRAPWPTENRWDRWTPAAQEWSPVPQSAHAEPPGDPMPTDQWVWSNDRWQSPNEPWATPATDEYAAVDPRTAWTPRGRADEADYGWSAHSDDTGPDDSDRAEQGHAPVTPTSATTDTAWAPRGSTRHTAAEPRRRRGGRHRMPPPPTALKGRAAIVAVAAGAIVAAGQNLESGSAKPPAQSVTPMALGQPQAMDAAAGTAAPHSTEPGLLEESPATLGQFADMLHNGSKVADEISADIQAKLRPLFVKFTSGTFTSGYGMRWGTLHGGVDVAAPIGTPIVAVEDGTVISAGPASGFGMWVRVLGDDGTITVYGHINTALVSIGQRVTAGDEIATVGNRGETTGPHCHFEVWLNGTNRVDPLPWLATRGIGLGPERD